MKKFLFALLGFLIATNAHAAVLSERLGGTGESAYTLGDILYAAGTTNLTKLNIGINGDCLKVTAGIPSWGSCGSGGGGTDGNWNFFNGSGIRLATTTNQVLIGASSTTTRNALEVIGIGYFSNGLLAPASSTIDRLTVRYATTTNATSTNISVLNLTATGSTTLQNFTGLNATTSNATTTGLAITGVTSTLLKTNSTGGVIPAVSGTDYSNFGSSVGPTELQATDFGDWTCNGTTCTLDATYLTANQTITLSGDASGSGSTAITVTVADDSHAHTGTTLSGIDISDDTNLAVTSPIVLTGDTVSIQNAAADGTTKGAASFTASDFDATTGNISIDYTNGQAASGSNKGFLTSADWTTFNNKQATISTTFPITLSGATIGFGGLTTSTPAVIGNIPYFSGVNSFANVATTSVTCTGDASCTPFTVIGSSPITINSTGGAGGSWATTSQNYYNSQFRDWSIVNGALSPTTTLGVGVYASSTISRLTVTNGTTTNATSTNLNISGTLDIDQMTSALLLTGSTGIVAEYAGTSCTNQFVRSLSALGAATCATVANTDLANSTISGISLGSNLANLSATNSTLTFSGTYNGGTARTIGLNLGNANTWTALQTLSTGLLSQASSTITRLTVTNGTTTNATSTNLTVSGTLRLSALNCSANANGGTLTTDANGNVSCADDDSSGGGGAYPFAVAGNATSTLTQFNGGLTSYASTTIGNGTQAGGLTISGGATTTGSVKIGSGSATILFDGATGSATTTQATTTSLYVSGTASTTNLLINGYVQSAKIDTAFIFATTTLGTGTTTLKLAGFKQPTSFISFGCSSSGGGTFKAQLGDSNASSTMITSSTGLTTTYTALSSNNAFTTGETVWFSIGNVSGTVKDPTCSYQRVVTTSD